MEMVVRGREEMKPHVLKLGATFAFCIASFLISHRRYRLRPPGFRSRSVPELQVGCKGLKDALRILKNDDSLAKIINGASTTMTTITTTTTTFLSLSSSGDDEGLLKDSETKLDIKEELALKEEILHLKELVWSLQERERSIEFQLFEYYGLQEQDNTIKELESQLKLNNVETQLLSIKIESLQGDHQRLQVDYSKTRNELEATRNVVRAMKRKLKMDGEQAKEKIISLQQRISILQSREDTDAKHSADMERKIEKLKEFENEVVNLRIQNSWLEQKNSELIRKLEGSIVSTEVKALEEARQLREMNNKLSKEIEELQSNHCANVEELVYLRWVNACLRYELRNYQPPPGKTIARDLSKTLSPKSEEKAKQLILEYAKTTEDKGSSPMDFDTEYSPSSQASSINEYEETTIDVSTRRHSSSKVKLFSKLKKLILGKDTHVSRPSTSCSNSDRRVSSSTCSIDDVIGRYSDGSASSSVAGEITPGNEFSGGQVQRQDICRSSIDFERMRRIHQEENKDTKGVCYKKGMCSPYSFQSPESTRSSSEAAKNGSQDDLKLKRFAEALKRSQGTQIPIRRSISLDD